ncbi:MAG: AraC family transcriptional regulator [Acidobacteriaceae bacterium]|jgi:AraC family transcriptional regulator of adaptative response/methylated-DNA-[protein]-cysteine methyltransferase|nr:AraC family transcriptional regulator [Acidobacteriaceae bacterium]MEA2543879.1 AraC family transcriptional regulator [Acidobacteriaceae bacterium]
MQKRRAVSSAQEPTSKQTQGSHRNNDYESLTFGIAKSSLGHVLVATGDKGVVAVLIGGSPTVVIDDLRTRFPKAHLVRDDQMHATETSQLINYIESAEEDVSFDLDLRGTEFQRKVWRAVRKIKIGETTTYTDLARSIGAPKAIRAVANACSINPFAFAVPCHRVLHKERALSFSPNRGNDRQRPMVDREAKVTKQ